MTSGLFPRGISTILPCLVIFSYFQLINSQSDTIVVWSQESHQWTRLRGIYGDPKQWVPSIEATFVGSTPSKNQRWTAVTHDPAEGHLYWVDRRNGSTIYRQLADDSLLYGKTQLQLILNKPEFEITGLAVDWNTGAIYFSEKHLSFIGVTAATNDGKTDVYRMVASGNIYTPIGVAVLPNSRKIYWMDSGKKSVEFSNLDGRYRRNFNLSINDVGEPLCMTVDTETALLYWASKDTDGIVRLKYIQLASNTPRVITQFPLGRNYIPSIASYQKYIYVLNVTQYKLEVYLNDNTTTSPSRQNIIDATSNDIVVTRPKQESFSKCEELECSQICLNVDRSDGNYESNCVCGNNYIMEPDGKTCTWTDLKPRYVYSHKETVWAADGALELLPNPIMDLNEKQILSGFQEVRALAVHVADNFVYMDDVVTDVLSRSSVQGEGLIEITVNTRQVEGMSVDWLGRQLYWADSDLKHIMCSQLDGRFHSIILNATNGINRPTFLTVDSQHGKLIFVSVSENNQLRSVTMKTVIKIAGLDGSDLKDLVTGEVYDPHALAVDPRENRLYWIDSNRYLVSSVKLDGSQRRDVIRTDSPTTYGIALFQNYISWTQENNNNLRFGETNTGGFVSVNTLTNKTATHTYDIETFHLYAQPDAQSLCHQDNGGCDQLCFHVSQTERKCGCAIGFSLSNNTKTCTSNQLLANFLLFVDPYHKQVYQVTAADNSTSIKAPQGVPLPRMNFPTVVDVDRYTGDFYWLDTRNSEIRSANTIKKDTKLVWKIPTGHKVQMIALDHQSKYLYYTDSQKGVLGRMKLNGDEHIDLRTGLSEPSGLIYHKSKKLFWTEKGNKPRIVMMDIDSSQVTVLTESNLDSPLAITVPDNDDSVLFWCDKGAIFRMNITSSQINKIYDIQGSQIISLATNGDVVYFTRWDEKGIYMLADSSNMNTDADHITQGIFARITDIKVIPLMATSISSNFPVVPVAAGLAAGFLFLLLLALLLLLLCLRKPKKKAAEANAVDGTADSFDPNFDSPYVNYNNGMVNGHTEPITASVVNSAVPDLPPESDLYVNTRPQSIYPPEALSDGSPDGLGVVAGVPVMIPATAPRKQSKKPTELPAPEKDPTFELQREKVATRIHRLANRLRNRLSTVRWSGGPIGQDNLVPDANGDPQSDYKDAVPYTKDTEKKNYEYKPQLHRLPRGFAPASHSVPNPVKNTWGRNKAAMAMKGEVLPPPK